MSKGFAYQEIGRRIRSLRGGDRQKDWAVRLGCDQGYISQVENGVTKPSLAFLKGVSSISNASIDWILTGIERNCCEDTSEGQVHEAAEVGHGTGAEGIVGELEKNPKLLLGVARLLKLDDDGKIILEAFHDMDEERLKGLAAFIGV